MTARECVAKSAGICRTYPTEEILPAIAQQVVTDRFLGIVSFSIRQLTAAGKLKLAAVFVVIFIKLRK